MDSKDKKEFINIVGTALEDIVLPKFDEIDQRFDGIDKRFSEMDKKLDKTKNDLVGVIKAETELIYARLDKIEGRLFNLETKNDREHKEILEKIEEIRKSNADDIDELVIDVHKLEKRMTKLEAKVA